MEFDTPEQARIVLLIIEDCNIGARFYRTGTTVTVPQSIGLHLIASRHAREVIYDHNG